MKTATEAALKAIVEKANGSTALDAMQPTQAALITQAALNLAHVLAILDSIERAKK